MKTMQIMFRAQLVLVLLALMASCSSKAQVPGFQGTVNNYDVGMNPTNECQHPSDGHPACSQWFHLQFQAFNNGLVHVPIRITNDSMNGYCGRVRIEVRDHPGGNLLGTFESARYCIEGKGADTNYHERTAYADWTFNTDSAVGQNGGDLGGFGMDEEYADLGPNWDQVFPPELGDLVKVGEAVVPALVGAPE